MPTDTLKFTGSILGGKVTSRMSEIITTLCNKVDDVIERVKNDLPDDFPTRVSTPIFEGMLERKRRLLIE